MAPALQYLQLRKASVMNTKAIIAALAVLGSSTAAMADSHAPRATVSHTVSVQRPIVTRTVTTTVSVQRPVTRPIVTRPVVQPVSVARPVVVDRDRGHGPVVHEHPVIVRPIVEHPIIERPIYQPVVYTQPVVDNCNAAGTYVGPIGALPDSYQNGVRSLTEPTALVGGREIINLGAQVGPIDNLILEANNDATTVSTVQVNFLDGSSQRFDLRETLDVGNPELTLQLGHRDVASLVVFGQSSLGATYQVLAT